MDLFMGKRHIHASIQSKFVQFAREDKKEMMKGKDTMQQRSQIRMVLVKKQRIRREWERPHELAADIIYFIFQLMLGTASPWLGQSLFVFDFVFLVVGLPSIVSARFDLRGVYDEDLRGVYDESFPCALRGIYFVVNVTSRLQRNLRYDGRLTTKHLSTLIRRNTPFTTNLQRILP
ncbi:hypothetical protein YC2023_015610 [Brassica napus]